jgi:diguanylate cyclase (GGDEF)-like protein
MRKMIVSVSGSIGVFLTSLEPGLISGERMISMDQLPYSILMLLATTVCIAIAVRVYRSRRKVARANPFTMMAIFASSWMAILTAGMITTNLVVKEILWGLIHFAILNTLLGLLFFSMEFSLRLKRIPKVILYVSIAAVLAVTAFSATNPLHHRMWTTEQINGIYVQVMGPYFAIQLGYTYLLAGASFILLLRAFLRSKGLLRRQTGLLLAGIAIPVFISLMSDVYRWNPLPYIDEPGLSVVFTVILFGWATLGFNTFYLLPVASEVIIRNMCDGVLVTDDEGLILFSNEAVRMFINKSEAQMNGQPAGKVLMEWLPEAFAAWEAGNGDIQLVAGEGPPHYFRMTISRLAEKSGESIGRLLLLYDITPQKNAEMQLNELAICDPLTGAYNRRYFYEMAGLYFSQMLRSGKSLSILMIDIDHFKLVNDTYGHVIGDQVLQKVTVTCKRLVRSPDIFSRFGGEEFVLAMPETALQDAVMVAERLCRGIEALECEPGGYPVTVSIGAAETAGEAGLTLDTLLARADEAMYLSKKAGRNRVTAWMKMEGSDMGHHSATTPSGVRQTGFFQL